MDIQAYLKRIGFAGDPWPDLATLRRIQRGHLENIPYENLDVQLGRRLTFSVEEAFEKLVNQRRGGWCYEMNGVMGWALETIGFDVMPVTGAIKRDIRGDTAKGNHLVLGVKLDRYYLADVGLGDGPFEPTPLEEGLHGEGWRAVRLERMAGGWWRFHNYENSFASSFDFQHKPADWKVMQAKCEWLQTSADSVFTQNAVCLRTSPEGYFMLVGRVVKSIPAGGTANRMVDSAEEYCATLAAIFGIELPEAGSLWPAIIDRHKLLFGN